MKVKYLIFGIMILVGLSLISGCVPSSFEHLGIEYSNCHTNQKYPIQKEHKLSILTGIAKENSGRKSRPILGISLNNKLLFNI